MTMLARPFLPFDQNAWLAVLVYLIVVSILYSLTNISHLSDRTCRNSFKELSNTLFDVWHSFLQGDSHSSGDWEAHKLFQLSFAFFVLVLLASYTPNLASMLVAEKQEVGTILDINDA